MKARIAKDCPWSSVTAFGGQHYTRGEWRSVPAGCEEEAGRHPYLETDGHELDAFTESVEVDLPLESYTLEELRIMGKAAGFPFAWNMKRETLIAKLSARSDE